MPSPKSGKSGKVVAPAGAKKPEEADIADPGAMAKLKRKQQASGTGKYAANKPKPHKPKKDDDQTDEEESNEEKTWIEIELVGEDDEPITGEKYRITLPDGTVDEGTLDDKGLARVDGIDPGTCQITFPNLDKDAWEKI